MFSSSSSDNTADTAKIETSRQPDVKLISQLIEKKDGQVSQPTPSISPENTTPKKTAPTITTTPIPTPVITQKKTTTPNTPQNKEVKATPDKEEKKEKRNIKFFSFPKTLYTIDQQGAEEAILSIPKKYIEQFDNTKQNLYIRSTKGNSWITYQLDNQKIHKYILKEGKEMFLQAQLIRMFVGNINSIEIYLNNLKIKTSSKSGVKSLVFPQERAKDFKIPLFIFQKDGTVISSQEYLQSREPVQTPKEETTDKGQ
jgi:hypothetical protein